MKRKAFKRVLAVVLVGALAAGLTVSASAADGYFDAPTSEMEVDPSYATAAVHRAASVLPEILGLSTVSGFSTINGGMPTSLDAAQGSLMLGAFGTNMNDNPDPFYYNLFYNFYAQENDLPLSQHAMLNDNNVSASPGGADTTVVDGYGTSISLAGRPDMLIGCSGNGDDISGYDAMIEDIRSGAIGEQYYQEGDENYDPYLVAYTFTYTYDMVVVANTVAYLMDNYMVDEGKYGRYSPQVLGETSKTATDIAEDLGDYVNGISTYVLSEIANGDVQKKTSAVISSIDATAGTITLANSDSQSATSNNRIAEYCELVTDNIANTYLGTSVTVPEMMDNADAIVFSGGNMNTLLTAIQNYDSANGTNYEDQLDEKVIIQNYPDSVYGITMNSIENTMGFGYFVGYLYCDVLPQINPVYMTAYFYQNFYHVSNLAYVEDILNVTCQNVNLPTGVTTDLSNYDETAIYNDLQQGKDYYYDNFDQFSETALTEVWQEDRDAGIELGEEGIAWKKFDPVQALEDEIAAVEALNEDDYTADSWEPVAVALSAAKALFDEEGTPETDYYAALLALQDAESGLIYVGDLKTAIAVAQLCNEEDYTVASWRDFSRQLSSAQSVAANAAATQSQIDSALDDLEDAFLALVSVADLNAEIATAESLNEEDYTTTSWATLEQALADAQSVAAKPDATQDEIDDALSALEDAVDSLVPTATAEEKQALQDAIDEAKTISEDDYTTSSWDALQQAIADAQAVVDDRDATSEDVSNAQDALEDAVANLVPTATAEEKQALQDAIDEAKEISQSDYTTSSWDALQQAISDAQAVVDDRDATSEDVENASTELEDAIAGLEEKASEEQKEDLQDEINEAEEVNPDEYTDDSYQALEDAVNNAKDVLDNPDASADEVEAAMEEVKTAMDNLQKKSSTPTPTPTPSSVGTGVIKVNGEWGYYVDGKLQSNYNGVAPMKNKDGWWFIKNGKVDFSANTVGKNQNGWWLVEKGKVNFNYTGVANYKNDYGWWYVKDGKVDFSKNSVEKNKYGWWYVKGGKVDFSANTVAKNQYGWWYISGGKVNFNANTVAKNQYGWWYIEGGKVNFNYTNRVSNYKNPYGWWYIKGGKVDFTYNGKGTNKYGTWNVVNGKVVF